MKIILAILAFIVAAFSVAACAAVRRVWLELQEEKHLGDHRDDVLRTAIRGQEDSIDTLQGQIGALSLKIAEMEKKLGELPLEQMEAEYKSLAAFNEGVQNIMGFGTEVPKLNKEAVKRG